MSEIPYAKTKQRERVFEMSMDCRDFLDVKQYEFLMNWFMRRQQELGLASLDEPLSYDGDSQYDRLAAQLIAQANVAYLEQFHQSAPAIVFTNLFHLAELELQGKRRPLKVKSVKTMQ
jgi:hypothetical protein